MCLFRIVSLLLTVGWVTACGASSTEPDSLRPTAAAHDDGRPATGPTDQRVETGRTHAMPGRFRTFIDAAGDSRVAARDLISASVGSRGNDAVAVISATRWVPGETVRLRLESRSADARLKSSDAWTVSAAADTARTNTADELIIEMKGTRPESVLSVQLIENGRAVDELQLDGTEPAGDAAAGASW